MTMPSIVNFDISFIKRTSENLKHYEASGGQYEFTMLINSLLGLIIVPNEMNEKREFTFDFLEKKVSTFPKLKELFSEGEILLLKDNVEVAQRKFFWLSGSSQKRAVEDISLKELLNRMRNGIAHFGITPIALSDNPTDWGGVIVRNYRKGVNYSTSKTKVLDFELCIMQNEIRTFAEFISQKYISTTKK